MATFVKQNHSWLKLTLIIILCTIIMQYHYYITTQTNCAALWSCLAITFAVYFPGIVKPNRAKKGRKISQKIGKHRFLPNLNRIVIPLKSYGIYQIGRYGRWIFQGIADSIRDGFVIGSSLKKYQNK